MLIPAQNSNKANYKIQDYFANRQIKEDVKCNIFYSNFLSVHLRPTCPRFNLAIPSPSSIIKQNHKATTRVRTQQQKSSQQVTRPTTSIESGQRIKGNTIIQSRVQQAHTIDNKQQN
jgi:hypothetical protein